MQAANVATNCGAVENQQINKNIKHNIHMFVYVCDNIVYVFYFQIGFVYVIQ